MSELDFKWYGGSNGENFTSGPFETREDAISETFALGDTDYDGGIYVIEAAKRPLLLSNEFDASDFLERAEERIEDAKGDDGNPIFELTEDQLKSLDDVVKKAISGWQVQHGLHFDPWVFSASRNEEYVPASENPDHDV